MVFNNKNNCSGSLQPEKDMALVVEGGGQRGIFTAGVLDSWIDCGYNPFAILIGSSAGAQNLSSYLSRQKGFGKRAILDLTKHPNFFKLSRAIMGKNAMDLDWYFDQTHQAEYQLRVDLAHQSLSQRSVLFAATQAPDYNAKFFQPTQDNWLLLLKASCAIPMLYKDGVTVGSDQFIDGGVAAPLPVEEAYRRGARNIVVIRTMAAEQEATTFWAKRLHSIISRTNKCPVMLDLLVRHEHAYEDSLKFIENPPAGVSVKQIFPPDELASNLLGSSLQGLKTDYQQGLQEGLRFLATCAGDVELVRLTKNHDVQISAC